MDVKVLLSTLRQRTIRDLVDYVSVIGNNSVTRCHAYKLGPIYKLMSS